LWQGCQVPLRASLDKQPADVAAMFDETAARYDLLNDLMSGGIDRLWRRETVAALKPRTGEYILDVAAGTGTSSTPLAEHGALVFPTDLSVGMLEIGRRRHPELTFVAGDALALPYCDEAFDAVTMSFGLRNVSDTLAGLRELRRVTRPGGRIVICEFSTPTSAGFRQLYQWYLHRITPLVSHVSSNPVSYEYLVESILTWHDQPTLANLMAQAGWRDIAYRNLTGGIVALHRASNP
jgi:demethylmenaquinone methyltransferase/2-methoxy-6-polyprenyl-1,4-benzoquinol methylase